MCLVCLAKIKLWFFLHFLPGPSICNFLYWRWQKGSSCLNGIHGTQISWSMVSSSCCCESEPDSVCSLSKEQPDIPRLLWPVDFCPSQECCIVVARTVYFLSFSGSIICVVEGQFCVPLALFVCHFTQQWHKYHIVYPVASCNPLLSLASGEPETYANFWHTKWFHFIRQSYCYSKLHRVSVRYEVLLKAFDMDTVGTVYALWKAAQLISEVAKCVWWN